MSKIGIVVCGNSGLDYVNVNYPIRMIRSTVSLDNKEYEDYVDITAEEFYQKVVDNPNIQLSTSQTSTGVIANVYEDLKSEGCTDILVITVSSKLSGTFQGAALASELVSDVKFHLIDSKSVSHGEAYLVFEAIKMIENGKSIDQIVEKLEEMRDNVTIYILVDTLKYLIKNGRLSATSGFIGSLLKIKPLLKIEKDGSLLPFEKIRTTKKARERLLQIVVEDLKNIDADIFIAYTNNKKEAEELRNELLTLTSVTNIDLVPLTPVVGAHAGPGTIGLGFIKK
ncbi:MAG TPA: DegV family protein [Haploplasma sp.]|nr:DegV family protein [Haploplasma sp.]